MEILTENEHQTWDRFVATTRRGTIFHTSWWHRAWGVKTTILARRDKNGEIVSGIPMYIARFPRSMGYLGVRGIRRPPLTPINSPVFVDCLKSNRCSKYTHVKKELLSAIEALPRVDFYDFGLGRNDNDLMPFIWNGFDTHVGYTYVVPAAEVQTWENNMSDKTRRALKAAHREFEEKGCKVQVNPPFEEASALFFETSRAKGFKILPYETILPRWWSEVMGMDSGRSYVLREKSGRAICSSLIVWDSHTAYCLVNGMLRTLRKDSHLNMILFEVMIRDALQMGLNFDFNGSVLLGVERFFRGWGGELRQHYRVTKIPSMLAYFTWKSWWYIRYHRKREWVGGT